MATPKAKAVKATVNLVKFKGEYFPKAEEDYRLLVDHKVPVFRISESTLEILRRVLLKGVRVEIETWSIVYPALLESFKASLLAQCDAKDIFSFKNEQNWLMIATDTTDENNATEYVNLGTRFYNQMAEFMGRYGIRAKIESKVRSDHVLTKIDFSPDASIVPSFYFGCKEDYNVPMEMMFNLGNSARLKFSKRLTIQGEPTFGVIFEDRFGDHWQEAFSRGFPFKLMKPQDCEAAINFFVDLHNRLTVKRKV